MDTDFEKIGRILVRGVNWVGDTVMTYPAVERLKGRFPRSHLAILVRENLVDLWKTVPYVDEVIPFQQKRGWNGVWGDLRLSLLLKKKGFDLAVIFPRSFRSAYPISLARIPIRLGYQDEGRSLLLTHKIRRTGKILNAHRIHYYQNLIDTFGFDERVNPPRIFLREEDRDWATERLRDLHLLNGRPLIGMNPGATYGLAKCWYPDGFGELGRRLVQKRNASILLFGAEGERATAKGILDFIKEGVVDLTGKTSLLQLAALLERCQVLVTNDTGTLHVATAVGTPVVAIFGPTNPGATGPWGEGHAVVKREVPCSPCLERVCPTDHACMRKISVEDVEKAVGNRLRSVER